MADEEKFDAIIIGAGLAGSACAYALAREGKSVLLIERGPSAGSKNVTGGRIYTYALEMLEPGLTLRAPLERKIVREQITMLGADSSMTVEYGDNGFGEGVPQSYSVLRAPFDDWFAAEAEAQGAMIVAGILVEELIEKDGRIVGIKAGDDEMYADVVIAADGVNSLIAQRAGLRGEIEPDSVGVGVKEIIELPAELISARFGLEGDQGAARVVLGCTEGISGGAFMYTNKNSISLGVIFNPKQAGKHGKQVHEMMQEFKMNPYILPLLQGGKTVEYSAHLVPELGYSGIPKRLHREGLLVLGDAAGFCISAGIILRGMDLAILSGIAAANAVIKSESTAQLGGNYQNELENFVLPAMRTYKDFHKIMSMPRLFTEYPQMMNDIMKGLFSVGAALPEKMMKTTMKAVKNNVGFGKIISDGITAVRSA